MPRARIPKKLSGEALWEYALRVLAARAHSASELRQKLRRRAESPDDVNATMSKLREYGLADDKKFSELFAASRLANAGFGQFRVLRELRSKQVAPAVAEQAVAGAFAGINEKELAEKLLLRKYRGKDLRVFLSEEKNLASAYRRLRTAGFSSAATLSVLKHYSRKAEECEPADEPETTDLT